MKENKKNSLKADISYMMLFILLFICVAFIVFSENTFYNIAALCIVFAIMIISHFTSITSGLILNTVVIFAGFSWYLYQLVLRGTPILQDFYFWIVISPVLTVVSYLVFQNTFQIEEENITLRKRVQNFSIIDEVTELKNIQAYEMEFPVYQRISTRYEIGLMMIIWQFRYEDDLRRILGRTGMEQTAVEFSKSMEAIFRKEDVVYILSKNPYEWGSLLLTKEDSEELLMERIKEKIAKLDFTEILGKNAPRLDVRVGIYFAQCEDETPLSMLEKAKKKLQYDV